MKKKLGSMSTAAKQKTMALVSQIRGKSQSGSAASGQARQYRTFTDDAEQQQYTGDQNISRRHTQEEDEEYSALHDKRGGAAVRMANMPARGDKKDD